MEMPLPSASSRSESMSKSTPRKVTGAIDVSVRRQPRRIDGSSSSGIQPRQTSASASISHGQLWWMRFMSPAFAAALRLHAKSKRLERTCIARGPDALPVGWMERDLWRKQPSSGDEVRKQRKRRQRVRVQRPLKRYMFMPGGSESKPSCTYFISFMNRSRWLPTSNVWLGCPREVRGDMVRYGEICEMRRDTARYGEIRRDTARYGEWREQL